MEEELVVQFSPESSAQPQGILPVRIVREIWREITFGVGTWGALRPLDCGSFCCCSVPFLGQHFNRQHRRAAEWSFLQIPLALTLLLWIGLYLWSIFDAWRDAVGAMGDPQGQVDLVRRSNRRQDRPNPNDRRRQNRLAEFQKMKFDTSADSTAQYMTDSSLLEWPGWSGSS